MRRSYTFFKAYMLYALSALHTAAREKNQQERIKEERKKQHFMWKSKKKTSSTTTIPRQRVRLHRQLCDGNCRRGIQIQLVCHTHIHNTHHPGHKHHVLVYVCTIKCCTISIHKTFSGVESFFSLSRETEQNKCTFLLNEGNILHIEIKS